MKDFGNMNPCNQRSAQTRRSLKGIAFWLSCLALLAGQRLSAQVYTPVDIRDLYYTVIVADTTLMMGQSIPVTIEIGNSNLIVRQAIGFDLWVELGCNAKLEPTLQPSMANSWMQEIPLLPLETKSTTVPNRYDYHFLKTFAVNGNGLVIKLILTAQVNNVHSSRLIARAGGLVLVDNLELKRADPGTPLPTEEAMGLTVWPNPAANAKKSAINLSWQGETIASTTVMNLGGQVLRQYGATHSLDLSDMPAGIYMLRVRNAHGKLVQHKLVLY